MSKPPERIAIDHDEYQASHVGRASDGRQFFLTNPFVSALGAEVGREFVALYLFDRQGRFLEAYIDDLGARAELDGERLRRVFEQRLAQITPVLLGRIEVQPFQVERFDTIFGLVPRPPEEPAEGEEDDWRVTVEPGDYMAFQAQRRVRHLSALRGAARTLTQSARKL